MVALLLCFQSCTFGFPKPWKFANPQGIIFHPLEVPAAFGLHRLADSFQPPNVSTHKNVSFLAKCYPPLQNGPRSLAQPSRKAERNLAAAKPQAARVSRVLHLQAILQNRSAFYEGKPQLLTLVLRFLLPQEFKTRHLGSGDDPLKGSWCVICCHKSAAGFGGKWCSEGSLQQRPLNASGFYSLGQAPLARGPSLTLA